MRNILILLTLILVACGPDDKHIRLDGRLLNLNQGEFVVYSTDGALSEIDTIVVKGGRFEYEPMCTRPGT
ncbi:MAG: AhpC/TSA family antioxidant, partial [Prevotella sp.]|nr:AhpC/TSA family antioxidant [Prevotella sp.]